MLDQLLIPEPPLQILPSLATTIGFIEAAVLQEVHYCLDSRINNNFFEGQCWVENVSKHLQYRFPFWNEEVINLTITHLEELGILVSWVPRHSQRDAPQDSPRTRYHTINYQGLKGAETFSLEEEDKKLCRHMIKIWNKTVQNNLRFESEEYLSSKSAKLLIQFLEGVLGHYQSWETYCELISQYGFLGKVSLNWALMPSNAYRVIKPNTRAQAILDDKPWKDFFEEIKETLRDNQYDAEWFQISQTLAKRLGQGIYRIWFLGTTLAEITEKTIIIQIDSSFKKEYIKKYFLLDLVYAIQAAYPVINRIDFLVIGEP